jgi:gliding motility-associated-like protein
MLKFTVSTKLIKLFFTCSIATFSTIQATCQNLVSNPSFEEYHKLFYNFVQTKEDFNSSVKYWEMPTTGTTDIFTNLVDQIYNNNPHATSNIAVGSQDPKDGDFMIGLFVKSRIPNYREYAQIELLQPLSSGKVYFVGCYVSLADNMGDASNNIGMLFTKDKVGSSTFTLLEYSPQINSNSIIEERENWIFFSSTFTASEPFSYLTIGNFYTDENTHVKKVNDSAKIYSDNVYYFIDSVFVEPINNLEIPNMFTPNQDEYNETFEIRGLQENRWRLTIVNRWGQIVYQSRNYNNKWTGKGLSPGVYYYYIKHRYVSIEYKGSITILN